MRAITCDAEADLPPRWEDTEFIALPDGIAEETRTWFHGQQL